MLPSSWHTRRRHHTHKRSPVHPLNRLSLETSESSRARQLGQWRQPATTSTLRFSANQIATLRFRALLNEEDTEVEPVPVCAGIGGAFSCFIRPRKLAHALCPRGSFREDQPSGGRVRITSAIPPRGDLAKSRSRKPNEHLTQATSHQSLGTYTLPRSRRRPTA